MAFGYGRLNDSVVRARRVSRLYGGRRAWPLVVGASLYIGSEGRAPVWRLQSWKGAHLPVGSRCVPRAASTHLIKAEPSKGLARKQIAPSLNARTRTASLGNAVMKTKGKPRPCLRRKVCSSIPLIPGIRTSEITQEVSSNRGECKNSAADANEWTVYPCALRRLSMAMRKDASSSMTEISAVVCRTACP